MTYETDTFTGKTGQVSIVSSHVVKPTLGRQKINVLGMNFGNILEPILNL